VFRHGYGRHLEFLNLVEKFSDSARPVEQGEFGVEMKVNEVLTHSISLFFQTMGLFQRFNNNV